MSSSSSTQKGFPYKCILLIGATSGIGWHLASKLHGEGRKIILVGRRKDRLDEFVEQHGGGAMIGTCVFDITDLGGIPAFIEKVTKEHPEIDAVWHNSGIQRGFNFAEPASVDLDMAQKEFTTNYTSALHLTKAVLPFLMEKHKKDSTPTALIFTTSVLALLPLGRCPNYCATKAALHQFLFSLRGHMETENTGVRVIEVLPPSVQTELHDEEVQPDIKNGRMIGMGVKEFVNELWGDLNGGEGAVGAQWDEFPVGEGKSRYEVIEKARRSQMHTFPLTPAKVQK